MNGDEQQPRVNTPDQLPDQGPSAEPPQDSGSQALSEALRSSFVIVKVIMVLLVIVFFASGIFTVAPQERAIVLRFGRAVGTLEEQLLGPGLHWSFPYPIDEVVRIPSGRIQTVTSTAGWYATSPEQELAGMEPYAGPSLNPAIDGYVLTGDGNIAHVRVTLSYRITDPLAYALNFVNASSVVVNSLNNSMLRATAHFRVDGILRLDVLRFQETVVSYMEQLIEEQKLGITVEQASIRAIAPRQVQPAFDQVLSAELDRRRAIDEAQGDANRILSRARGEADNQVNSGKTDRTRLIQEIASDARYFTNQLPHFRSAPDLFMARVQIDSLRRALTNAQDTIMIPARADGRPREIRLQLSREPAPPRRGQPQQQGQGQDAAAGPPR